MEKLDIQIFAEGDSPADDVQVTPPDENGGDKVNPNKVLRTLAEKYHVNLFEVGGVDKLIENIDTKDKALESANKRINEFSQVENTYKAKQEEDAVKIEVLRSGLDESRLEEIVALAKVNGQTIQDGLKVVKEKYGNIFGMTTEIGRQHNDSDHDKPPVKSEVEKYMESDPRYAAFYKNKK